jgi:hypothetical protein
VAKKAMVRCERHGVVDAAAEAAEPSQHLRVWGCGRQRLRALGVGVLVSSVGEELPDGEVRGMARAATDRWRRRFEEAEWQGDAGAPPATGGGGRQLGRCRRRGMAAGGGAPMRCRGWRRSGGVLPSLSPSSPAVRLWLLPFPEQATAYWK